MADLLMLATLVTFMLGRQRPRGHVALDATLMAAD
jgi:hypothetical protein